MKDEITHFPVTIDACASPVKGKKRASLGLLLALMALGLSGYTFYHQYMSLNRQAAINNQASITALQANTQALSAQVQQMQQTISAMQTAQQATETLLQTTREPELTLRRMNLESARVNVQLAHSLLWQHQTPDRISKQLDLAMSALEYAGPSGQNLLHQVQALNTQVNGLPAVDINAVNTQLDQLSQTLSTLNFVPPVVPNAPQAAAPTQTQLSGWRTGLAHSWQQLKSLLIIRSDNQIGPSLVSESARFDAVRNLQLIIDEAKWNAITANPQYAQNLTELQTQVQALTVNDKAQQTWLAQLQALQAVPAVYPADKWQTVETSFNQILAGFDRTLAR